MVVERVVAGASRREAARHLKIGEATAVRWLQRIDRTGSVSRTPQGGRSRSPLEAHAAWLLELVATEPDLTLDQIVARLAERHALKTTKSSVDRFFDRHAISFKKNPAGGRAGETGRGRGPRAVEGGPAKP
jgi:transposase